MFRNRSASLWVERYFGVADMCRTGPYAWVPVASRPGVWSAVRYFGVADMCRTGPYAWVPGASRPGFWYALATRVPQQIRNSLGGAVKGTRFADIPLDTCSAHAPCPEQTSPMSRPTGQAIALVMSRTALSRRRPLVIVAVRPPARGGGVSCPGVGLASRLPRERCARGQGACCFRVASSRRCDDECSSASGRERRQRLVAQRHQSQARTVRALRRPASKLSQGIAEPSAAARHIGKAAAKIVQTLLQSLQSDCQICKRRGPGTTSPQ